MTLVLDRPAAPAELRSPAPVEGLELAGDARGVRSAGGAWSWELTLVAAHPGRFELPPFEVGDAQGTLRSPPLVLECVSEIDAARYAFVEVVAPRRRLFERERVTLKLRFGVEREFLRWNVQQPFAQRVEVPLQVHAAWIDRPPDALAEPSAPPASGATFVLGDGIARATRVGDVRRDERDFSVLEFEQSYVAHRSGALTLQAPSIFFAYTTRLERDVFGELVPADREEATLHGSALEIEIAALPELGRPADFSGAVGHFELAAEAAPRELRVGESLKLVLAIRGDGSLERVEAPRLDELGAFHVRGRIEDALEGRRVVTYDLVPLDARVREVPAIEFSYFDPLEPAGYRVARTEPITLRVLPQAPSTDSGAGETPPPQPPTPPSTQGAGSNAVAVGALAGAAALLAIGTALWVVRRRARGPALPDDDGALTRFRRAVEDADADPCSALTEFLAAKLACRPAAVVGPDLARRLGSIGVPEPLAARTAQALEHCAAARFGGTANAPGTGELSDLVERLAAATVTRAAER